MMVQNFSSTVTNSVSPKALAMKIKDYVLKIIKAGKPSVQLNWLFLILWKGSGLKADARNIYATMHC